MFFGGKQEKLSSTSHFQVLIFFPDEPFQTRNVHREGTIQSSAAAATNQQWLLGWWMGGWCGHWMDWLPTKCTAVYKCKSRLWKLFKRVTIIVNRIGDDCAYIRTIGRIYHYEQHSVKIIIRWVIQRRDEKFHAFCQLFFWRRDYNHWTKSSLKHAKLMQCCFCPGPKCVIFIQIALV